MRGQPSCEFSRLEIIADPVMLSKIQHASAPDLTQVQWRAGFADGEERSAL